MMYQGKYSLDYKKKIRVKTRFEYHHPGFFLLLNEQMMENQKKVEEQKSETRANFE